MNFKIGLLIILSLIMPSITYDFIENQLITYVIDFIKTNPRFRRLTIHSKMPEKLSSTSTRFIQRLSSEFITLSINTSEFSSGLDSQRLANMKKWLHLRSQRKSMNILFVDDSYENDVEQALVDHIKFLAKYSLRTTRPRCICFLVSFRTNVNLLQFFKFSWSQKFLDIIVIEVIKPINPKRLLSSILDNTTVFIHEYNPFNDMYFHYTLFEKMYSKEKLFNYKLNSLHGYVLKTGMFDNIPMVMIERNYTGNDIWGMAQGLDITIARTLAERMNFTASIKVVYSDNPNLKRFNVSNDYMDRALNNENIDFAVNFYTMVGSKPLEDMVFESSIFLYPFSSNLIVKQYGKSVIKLSQNMIIITMVITVTIVVFSVLTRILRLGTKIWTPRNIANILVGSPLLVDFEKLSDRILFLTLAVISSALSVNILQQLLDIYLWQDMFPQMTSLRDVVKTGIIPSITRNSKTILSSYNNTALQQVLQYSTSIDSEEMVANCIEEMISHKHVNGCEVDSILGKLVSRSFSDKEYGWIISFVEEPIVQPCWTAMITTKTSPYMEKFNLILRRFSETGLLSFWYYSTLRNFTFIYKNFFGDEPLQYKNAKAKNRNYFVKNLKTPLHKKLILILIIGHAMSCLVFCFEFLLGHVRRRCINKKE